MLLLGELALLARLALRLAGALGQFLDHFARQCRRFVFPGIRQ
ncbi:hypothetical protein RA307_07125 [Xanthobacteraceae bacterium Astr-EGSB]|nr:hypothetical protein [Xanthobacteraceae bacterium Astr-EGSB]